MESGRSRTWGARLLVLAAAVLFVLAFRELLPSEAQRMEGRDYVKLYDPVARQILEGRGPVLEDGEPAIKTPPGYPYVLAGVFAAAKGLGVPEALALTVFCALSFGVACVLVLELGSEVWTRRQALLSAFGLMTYPLALYLTKQPNSELPFLPAFYGCILLFWHAVRGGRRAAASALGCGLAAGTAMLIRPFALGLGVLLAGLAVCLASGRVRRRFVVGLLILAGNLAAVLPWEAWVRHRTGSLIMLSKGSPAAMLDGLTYSAEVPAYADKVPATVVALERNIQSHREDIHSVRDILAVLREEGRRRPAALAMLAAWKAARSWYGTDSARHETAILAIQLIYLPFLARALALAWRSGGDRRRLAAIAFTILVYSWGMTFIVLPLVRYMVPAIGLLFAIAPANWSRLASPAPGDPAQGQPIGTS